MRIYVGNLSYNTDEHRLAEVFGEFGPATQIKIITDPDTGRSKGFGFLEMDEVEAQQAMAALNETDLDGRRIKVNEATRKGTGPARKAPRDKNGYGW